MEEIQELAKLVGLVPDTRYLAYAVLFPLAVSMLVEFFKWLYGLVFKNKPGSGMKTNLQLVASGILSAWYLFVVYGGNLEVKEYLAKGLVYSIMFAKLSSYYYKGLPGLNELPYLKNINTRTLFEGIQVLEEKIKTKIEEKNEPVG